MNQQSTPSAQQGAEESTHWQDEEYAYNPFTMKVNQNLGNKVTPEAEASVPAQISNSSRALDHMSNQGSGTISGDVRPTSRNGTETPLTTELQAVKAEYGASDAEGAGSLSKFLPTCQVEGCSADMALLKEYHQRYKICTDHLKSSAVLHQGRLQRFCQQCGRFHDVGEFDGDKRSCRARLHKHNARRRKKYHDERAGSGSAAKKQVLSAYPAGGLSGGPSAMGPDEVMGPLCTADAVGLTTWPVAPPGAPAGAPEAGAPPAVTMNLDQAIIELLQMQTGPPAAAHATEGPARGPSMVPGAPESVPARMASNESQTGAPQQPVAPSHPQRQRSAQMPSAQGPSAGPMWAPAQQPGQQKSIDDDMMQGIAAAMGMKGDVDEKELAASLLQQLTMKSPQAPISMPVVPVQVPRPPPQHTSDMDLLAALAEALSKAEAVVEAQLPQTGAPGGPQGPLANTQPPQGPSGPAGPPGAPLQPHIDLRPLDVAQHVANTKQSAPAQPLPKDRKRGQGVVDGVQGGVDAAQGTAAPGVKWPNGVPLAVPQPIPQHAQPVVLPGSVEMAGNGLDVLSWALQQATKQVYPVKPTATAAAAAVQPPKPQNHSIHASTAAGFPAAVLQEALRGTALPAIPGVLSAPVMPAVPSPAALENSYSMMQRARAQQKVYTADEVTTRIFAKLYDQTPSDLPPDIRQHFVGLMTWSRNTLDAAMRAGCVMLTVQGRVRTRHTQRGSPHANDGVSQGQYMPHLMGLENAEGCTEGPEGPLVVGPLAPGPPEGPDVKAMAESLLRTGATVWKGKPWLLQSGSDVAYVFDAQAKHVLHGDNIPGLLPEVISVVHMAVLAEAPDTVTVLVSNWLPGDLLLCRHKGRYVPLRVLSKWQEDIPCSTDTNASSCGNTQASGLGFEGQGWGCSDQEHASEGAPETQKVVALEVQIGGVEGLDVQELSTGMYSFEVCRNNLLSNTQHIVCVDNLDCVQQLQQMLGNISDNAQQQHLVADAAYVLECMDAIRHNEQNKQERHTDSNAQPVQHRTYSGADYANVGLTSANIAVTATAMGCKYVVQHMLQAMVACAGCTGDAEGPKGPFEGTPAGALRTLGPLMQKWFDAVCPEGLTVLHVAVSAEQNTVGLVQMLLQWHAQHSMGSAATRAGQFGLTPIHLAVLLEDATVLETLLQGGEDVEMALCNAEDEVGVIPAELAKEVHFMPGPRARHVLRHPRPQAHLDESAVSHSTSSRADSSVQNALSAGQMASTDTVFSHAALSQKGGQTNGQPVEHADRQTDRQKPFLLWPQPAEAAGAREENYVGVRSQGISGSSGSGLGNSGGLSSILGRLSGASISEMSIEQLSEFYRVSSASVSLSAYDSASEGVRLSHGGGNAAAMQRGMQFGLAGVEDVMEDSCRGLTGAPVGGPSGYHGPGSPPGALSGALKGLPDVLKMVPTGKSVSLEQTSRGSQKGSPGPIKGPCRGSIDRGSFELSRGAPDLSKVSSELSKGISDTSWCSSPSTVVQDCGCCFKQGTHVSGDCRAIGPSSFSEMAISAGLMLIAVVGLSSLTFKMCVDVL